MAEIDSYDTTIIPDAPGKRPGAWLYRIISKRAWTILLPVVLLSLTGCKPPAPDIRIYVLDGGRIDMDLSNFAQEDEYEGRRILLANAAFLVRHPMGDLMWDTGLDDALHDPESEAAKSRPGMSMPVTLESQLAELALTPLDIDYLSLSHSHWDHLGNSNLFSQATFLVDQDERARMFSEASRKNQNAFQSYDQLETAETIEFDGDYDVFGDGTVTILAMPGHTQGHTVLLIQLPEEAPILLSGDLYHLLEARARRTVPKWNTDVEMTLASMDRFEEIATELGARVIVQHSLSTFEKLPRIPSYLGDPKSKQSHLREQYEEQVLGLTRKAEQLEQEGIGIPAIATAMHAERRALGIDFKNRSTPEARDRIYERNLERYGDKLGPTLEYLVSDGKSWEDIIESAARPGRGDLN